MPAGLSIITVRCSSYEKTETEKIWMIILFIMSWNRKKWNDKWNQPIHTNMQFSLWDVCRAHSVGAVNVIRSSSSISWTMTYWCPPLFRGYKVLKLNSVGFSWEDVASRSILWADDWRLHCRQQSPSVPAPHIFSYVMQKQACHYDTPP